VAVGYGGPFLRSLFVVADRRPPFLIAVRYRAPFSPSPPAERRS
jgi:hypothetical protein